MQKVKDIRRYLDQMLNEKYPNTERRSFNLWILEYLFDFSPRDAIMNAEDLLDDKSVIKVQQMVELLAEHKPIQQIVGYSWFYGHKFSINEEVLIPRPETEELVAWMLKDQTNDKSILDIGTGSGCIPISLAKNSTASVTTLDISEGALKIAACNAKRLNVKINFILADILNLDVLNALSTYDVIVSNPPYVLDSDKELMSSNVVDYEPHLALFVPNNDALKYYSKITEIASRVLNPGGILYFEIHELKALEVKHLLKNKGFSSIEIRQDMQGKDRMIKALLNV